MHVKPAHALGFEGQDEAVAEPIAEAEAYIQYRLNELSSRNEHHRFEEIATRIARKRISANILIATGPVSSGGDQGRDAETFTTRIPHELPHSAGFSASASTAPVVVACTVQNAGLRSKVLADLAAICADDADSVDHVAYFSVHSISEGVTHSLKKTAHKKYNVSLDVFCGADIATFLAEPDLIWVARHYLELPSALVPPPEGEAAPAWYSELLEKLRKNKGPAALTPATQGEVTQGLRHATWDQDANADLPEWLDFMGAFLADARDGEDSELVFRACYEMTVARFRGMGTAAGVEVLARRAIAFARTSAQPNIVDDAVTLASYWGVMWSSGVGRAEAAEIAGTLDGLREHIVDLLAATDSSTHPVRTASLTGTLAFLHLLPNWPRVEQERGRPDQVEVAALAGVRLDGLEVDLSALSEGDLVDAAAAMEYLDSLVDVLPRARAYSARQLAEVFTLFAPLLSEYPSYIKIRDALDAETAVVEGQAATAERARDRALAFVKAGKPLQALNELHTAKVNWFNGDTLYGTVLTMRFIGDRYDDLGLTYAAKMYACAAAAIAAAHGDDEVKAQLPKALLEAARYSQHVGCWVDAAGLTEVALLARAQYLPDPFDLDKYPELDQHQTNAALQLSGIRKFWPALEPLIARAHPLTGWFDSLVELIEGAGGNPMSESEFVQAANRQLAGPLFGDVGPTRIIDFAALGIRWIFGFASDRSAVLTAEALVAAFQVLLADVAHYHPVLIMSTVRVEIDVRRDGGLEVDGIEVDLSEPVIIAQVVLSAERTDVQAQARSLAAICFQLLSAVHCRPTADLEVLMESTFKAGLTHKLFAGRPYEEAAGLLDADHYVMCGDAIRPLPSAEYVPTPAPPLVASTRTGTGYRRDEALQLIRERYEVASETLRYTLPRLLEAATSRATIVQLRESGWLDWQILVAIVNASWNWRMKKAGIRPGVGDPARAMQLAREPETAQSPRIPLEVFSAGELSMHIHMQTASVATRWDLRGRQEQPSEGAMRDLLTRRYHYGEDDVLHRDLLESANATGPLRPFLEVDGSA